MRTKRTVALLLCAVMTLTLCAALPSAAKAATYSVAVGGKNLSGVSSAVSLDINGEITTDSTKTVFIYDPTQTVPRITVVSTASSNVFTKKHNNYGNIRLAAISATNTGLDIYMENDLEIGASADDNDVAYEMYGIYVPDGTLSIYGPKSLNISFSGNKSAQYCYAGIFATAVCIKQSGTVTVEGGLSNASAYGVWLIDDITVEGTLNAYASKDDIGISPNRAGVYSMGALTVKNGGKLTAYGNAAGISSYGVRTDDTLTVENGGSLIATGGSIAGNTSEHCESYGVRARGIIASGTLKGTGGIVTLGSGNGNSAISAGVDSTLDIIVNNGNITGTGSKAAAQSNAAISYGVNADGLISVIGSSGSITGTGGEATCNGNAESIGVRCGDSLTIGSASGWQTSEVDGQGGSSNITSTSTTSGRSIGVYCADGCTVYESAKLTGTAGNAYLSVGVDTANASCTVKGALNGTGNGIAGGSAYGVRVGGGSISLSDVGSMTAKAVDPSGASTSLCYGVAANNIMMTQNSRLLAELR